MYFRRIIFLFAISFFVSAMENAFAEEPGSDPKTQMHEVCRHLCRSDRARCPSKSSDESFCDTRYIGCDLGCFSCRGVFVKCAEQPGGAADGRNCTKEFGACLKEKISSRESRDPIRFEGGDGRSEKTAVVVLGALTNLEGVAAESLWIAKKHPGWRKNSQALIHNGPHSFDRIEYETPNGPGTIWFEISAFLGKGGLEQSFGEPKPK